MIANDFNEFVNKISEAERESLNTPIGQECTEIILNQVLEKNPTLTGEEWKQIKSDFMTWIFCKLLEEYPVFMQECATHVYNELRGDE